MIAEVSMQAWDYAFLIWFLLVTTGVGLYYAKRAGKNLSEYFVSGRNLPWWALGTSMVATTFAADTPIVVSGWVISSGIAENWVWWSFVFGGALTVFLFSKYWRRSEVFTEVELIAHRYDGKAARVLRGFKAVYLGLIANALVIGWVTKAMLVVLEVVFPGVSPAVLVTVLLLMALGYTTLSGLWGVVATDVLQFVMALLGAVLLAVLGVHEAGGLTEMLDKVQILGDEQGRDILSIFPSGWDAFTASVMILMLVQWWAVYYPGAEPGGGGYIAQRMFAAIDENHARAGTLWFLVAHYVLRPWPWVFVALAAVAIEPRFMTIGHIPGDPVDAFAPEKAYPWMFQFLPVGLLGLVVASFFAAFMSTITTQLNLASSYLVNDLYLPFIAKEEDRDNAQAGVKVARLAVVLVLAFGGFVTWLLSSAGSGWMALMQLTAGTGLVLILRWLWWRVNAWSEISAMIASALTFCVVKFTPAHDMVVALAGGGKLDNMKDNPLVARFELLVIIVATTIVWLAVTFMTKPVATEKLKSFYTKVRPGGAWGPIAAATGLPVVRLNREMAMWGASSVMILGLMIGVGSMLLLRFGTGLGSLALGIAGAVVLRKLMRAEAAAESAAS